MNKYLLVLTLLLLSLSLSQCCKKNKKDKDISITSLSLNPINSLIFNLSIITNDEAKLYAEYYPPNVQSSRNLTLRTLTTDCSDSHEILLTRLYQNTTYIYKVYTKNSRKLLRVGQFVTGLLPAPLNGSHITVYGNPTVPLILSPYPAFAIHRRNHFMYRWDKDGQIVWYIEIVHPRNQVGTGFDERPDDHSILLQRTDSLAEYTPYGELKDNITTDGCPDFHHELFLEKNGVNAWSMNRELIYSGSNPVQTGDTFIKWNTEKQTIKIVAKTSSFYPTSIRTDESNKPDFLYVPCKNTSVLTAQDWTHGNSFFKSDHHHKYWVFSSRSLSKIFVFNKDLTELIYTVGGPSSNFTFPNPSDKFTFQHTAHILKDGNLLIFDNGNTSSPTRHSRVLMLKLNERTMEATKIWEYRLSLNTSCFSEFTGSVMPMDNGDLIATFPTCNWINSAPNGESFIVHLTSSGQELGVFKTYLSDVWFTFRTKGSESVNGEYHPYDD